jgi:hypothetical protein
VVLPLTEESRGRHTTPSERFEHCCFAEQAGDSGPVSRKQENPVGAQDGVTVPALESGCERYIVQSTEFAEALQLWFDQDSMNAIVRRRHAS